MPRMKIGPPKKFQLTPAQRRYARALLRGKTERQATKATGVQPATVNRWRSDPNWHDMVVKFQFEQLVEDLMPAVRKLVSGSRTNVSLAKLLEILAPLRTATVEGSLKTFADLALMAEADAAMSAEENADREITTAGIAAEEPARHEEKTGDQEKPANQGHSPEKPA